MPFDGTKPDQVAHSTVALLKRARERVANGWCKKRLENGEGSYCVIGAVRADEFRNSDFDALAYLYVSLPWYHRLLPINKFDEYSRADSKIGRFNDRPRTRRKDVLRLYDRAIAKARAE